MTAEPLVAWSRDFSYDYLRTVYETLAERFELRTLRDAVDILEGGDSAAFVRHDVDVSLERAESLAAQEAEWGVRTTYHVMLDSPFYDVTDEVQQQRIKSIQGYEHEIGLHYDPEAKGLSQSAVLQDVAELESALGVPVKSLSFHRPMPELLRGPTLLGGRVSGYAEPLMAAYLSDSAGRWREGDPVVSIRQIDAGIAQVLVHPEWWGDQHLAGPDRLDHLVVDLADELSWTPARVADELTAHIGVAPRMCESQA